MAASIPDDAEVSWNVIQEKDSRNQNNGLAIAVIQEEFPPSLSFSPTTALLPSIKNDRSYATV